MNTYPVCKCVCVCVCVLLWRATISDVGGAIIDRHRRRLRLLPRAPNEEDEEEEEESGGFSTSITTKSPCPIIIKSQSQIESIKKPNPPIRLAVPTTKSSQRDSFRRFFRYLRELLLQVNRICIRALVHLFQE